MTHASLLQDCRDYFQRAQSSWDAYFSKWEAMAEEDNGEEEDLYPDVKVMKQTVAAARQLRKKSIEFLNGKRLNRERKSKCKRVQDGEPRDRKRETEIIHTTENQTNLECEVVNNKHFEADLKAIFIEILSENTNKMGMFSVLSRTFCGAAETISNFSLSSMIMEKNGFSISPVSKTVLHSVSRNEFPTERIPRGWISDASTLSCVSVTPSHASIDANVTRHFRKVHDRQIAAKDLSESQESWLREKYIPNPANSLRRLTASTRVSNSSEGCRRETDSTVCLPSEGGSLHSRRKCMSEKAVKRKRVKSVFESSDDDSDDDANYTGKVLKIFCTPKRPRKSAKRETTSDDEDCFRIFDKVKTIKNLENVQV